LIQETKKCNHSSVERDSQHCPEIDSFKLPEMRQKLVFVNYECLAKHVEKYI